MSWSNRWLKSKVEPTNKTMKKGKIDKIVSVNEWQGKNGTILFHKLEIDNGDKIDIGKKKRLAIGEEITYEITDTQHEYHKAKAVNPNPPFQRGSFKGADQDAILYQVALKGVMDYYVSQSDPQFKPVFTADAINALALDIAKGAKANIELLKQHK